MHMLPAGLVGGLVGGLASALLLKKYVKEEVAQAINAAQETVLSERNPEKILTGLLAINVSARTKGFSEAVITLIESVIDLLVAVIPEMAERYSGEELTWETFRMADKHLPGLVDFFGALSAPDRQSKEPAFIAGLETMKTELEEVQQLVRNHQAGEFERKAATIKLKYGAGMQI